MHSTNQAYPRHRFHSFCLWGLFLVCSDAACAGVSHQFRAGAATSNITPPLGEKIVGGWAPIPAVNIHDELHVRCLALNDGTTTLVFAICDNVGIPREVFDLAKASIVSETKIPCANILTAATHTHSATTARGENKVDEVVEFTDYQKFLARRIADAVRLALHRLEPAEIGFGSVDEPSALNNRRWFVTDPEMRANPFGGIDQVRMNPPAGNSALVKPAGPIDPEITFLSVRSTEGEPIAILANYSLHYVGGVRKGDVSADYFGIFCNEIANRLDAHHSDSKFVGILTNGTSGDVNNINFRERGPRKEPYVKMREVAELVADRVAKTHSKLKYKQEVTLAAKQSDLELHVRKPSKEILEHFRKIDALPENEQTRHRRERIYSRRVKMLATSDDVVRIPLQAFRIGDIHISAIPFEVFTEIGLQLKAEIPSDDVMTIELANGSYGYLPTPAQHELGGYETWLGTCNVETGASEKIVSRLLLMHESLKVTE